MCTDDPDLCAQMIPCPTHTHTHTHTHKRLGHFSVCHEGFLCGSGPSFSFQSRRKPPRHVFLTVDVFPHKTTTRGRGGVQTTQAPYHEKVTYNIIYISMFLFQGLGVVKAVLSSAASWRADWPVIGESGGTIYTGLASCLQGRREGLARIVDQSPPSMM